MADRKLVVAVIGDDRSLQTALTRSSASVKRFNREVTSTLNKRPSGVSVAHMFAPTLTSVKGMQAEVGELEKRLASYDKQTGSSTVATNRLGASFAGTIGRGLGLGLAVTTAYQASRRLTEALTQTGEAAFTAEGRLKNVGASLLQGDLIGAFQALKAQPKTLEDLGIAGEGATDRLSELSRKMTEIDAIAQGTAWREYLDAVKESGDNSHEAADALERYHRVAEQVGTGNQRLTAELRSQVQAWVDLNRAVGDTFRSMVQFRGLGNAPIGAGAAIAPPPVQTFAQRLLGAGFTPTKGVPQPIGPTAKNAAAQIIAQGEGDLKELLRLQKIERDRLTKALAGSHGNVSQREALNTQLAQAKASVVGTERTIRETGAATAAAAKTARAAGVSDSWAKIIGSLELKVNRATLDKGLKNDLAALTNLKAGLLKQVAAGVDVASAQSRLVTVTADIASKQRDLAAQATAIAQARQFRAIGLSGTGGDIIPTVANLRKQLDSLSDRVIGSDVPKKLTNRLAGVRKVLAGSFGDITEETRSSIQNLFQTIRGEFEKGDQKGPLTKTTAINVGRIVDGLGLGRDAERELRARLSRFNSAGQALTRGNARTGSFVGGRTIIVENHNTIELDSQVVAKNVTKSQTKTGRGTRQKRGPNRRQGGV